MTSFSHPEGGRGTTGFGVVLTQVFEVLTILEGGTKGFHPLKVCVWGGGGGTKFYLVLRGGGAQKVSDPQFSNFVHPPPPTHTHTSL